MSPSRKRKRLSPRNSSIRSLPTSSPKTSQSVVVRMRRVRALPMKPLTPRTRTRIAPFRPLSAPGEDPGAERGLVHVGLPVGAGQEDLHGTVVAAVDDDGGFRQLDLPGERVVTAVGGEPRLPDRHARAEGVGEGAGPGARHGADEVVDLLRRAEPVDEAVRGLAAA